MLAMPERFFPPDEIEQIFANADMRRIADILKLAVDEKRSNVHRLIVHSPFTSDRTASLHINLRQNKWHCHATQQGGGPIELYQLTVMAQGGHRVPINEACQRLIDYGASFSSRASSPANLRTARTEKKKEEKLSLKSTSGTKLANLP